MSLKKAYIPPTIEVSYVRLKHSLTAGLNKMTPVKGGQYSTKYDENHNNDFDIVW